MQAVKNSLPRPVLARYARIYPLTWEGVAPAGRPEDGETYGLRWELFGPDGYAHGETGCRLQSLPGCPCHDHSLAVRPVEAPGTKKSCGCARSIPAVLRGGHVQEVPVGGVPAALLLASANKRAE